MERETHNTVRRRETDNCYAETKKYLQTERDRDRQRLRERQKERDLTPKKINTSLQAENDKAKVYEGSIQKKGSTELWTYNDYHFEANKKCP